MIALKQKAVSGIKWSAISQIGRQLTQLLTTVILARLLSPSDFGLVGMATAVVGFVNIFKDLGTSAAVIQQKELSEGLLSSIFWFNLCFGLFATLILLIVAPIGGVFYGEPRVVIVLRILSLGFFISSMGILHQALLERTLSFDSLAKVEAIAVVAGALVGIGLAWARAGVWSLVFQSLITVFVTTILLWFSSPWRPKRNFHWSEVRKISSFSLNLTGFSILNYFARNADYLLIGRYLGAQDLGYYTIAYRILLFPLQNITSVIGRVMYPILAAMQDDNERFSSTYLKIVRAIALITFPLMLGLLVLAEPLVLTFFGKTWQPIISLIMIFAPVGMIQSIGATVGSIYQAKGKTDWLFRWGLGAGALTVAGFIVGLGWGITGISVGYAVTTYILLYPSFAIPFRLINLRFVYFFRALIPSLVNSALMLVTLLILRLIIPVSLSPIVILILFTMVGIAVYVTASLLTNQGQIRELWDLTGLNRRKIRENA